MSERFSRDDFPGQPDSERPSPLDLPAFLPFACAQLRLDFTVRVVVEQQEEYAGRSLDDKTRKRGKSIVHVTSRTVDSPARSESASTEEPADEAEPPLVLHAVCDAAGRCVELQLPRARRVPRPLLRLLALAAPHHPLLRRLALRRCGLDHAALRDLARLPSATHLTELCLDDSPVPHRTYAQLLEPPARLRGLSLARCRVDDPACAALASRLAHPEPASRTLALLGLAGNRVGDAGAAALGRALRGNRALRHLDLSGNRLTDAGAGALLASLAEFPLTPEERLGDRRLRLAHIRARDEVVRRCRDELAAALAAEREEGGRARRRTMTPASSARSRKSVAAGPAGSPDALEQRARAMAEERLGAPALPFLAEEQTVLRAGRWCSTGNAALCALNLAYNSLSYVSLARLLRVLRRQEALAGRAGPGLVRVLLEGNPLPGRCAALDAVQELLDAALLGRQARLLRGRPERAPSRARAR